MPLPTQLLESCRACPAVHADHYAGLECCSSVVCMFMFADVYCISRVGLEGTVPVCVDQHHDGLYMYPVHGIYRQLAVGISAVFGRFKGKCWLPHCDPSLLHCVFADWLVGAWAEPVTVMSILW